MKKSLAGKKFEKDIVTSKEPPSYRVIDTGGYNHNQTTQNDIGLVRLQCDKADKRVYAGPNMFTCKLMDQSKYYFRLRGDYIIVGQFGI